MKWSEFRNLPNILSLSRPLLFLPLTALAVLWLQWTLAGAVIYVIGALTDSIDGWLARKQKQVTVTGKLIDPLADKLFFDPLPFFFYLQLPLFLRYYLIFIYVPLECALLFGGLYTWLVPSQNIFLAGANRWGKWKTASIVTFTILLFVSELIVPVPEEYLMVALVSAIGFAFMSFVRHFN
ncbi:MAG: CDP-diacylglycerol-glycerol-3-phosphate 3-phosphatidyltransferase [Candidatus Roizmanbacteria bacterium GW2011_GWB1_40_7]|uniref:CDP-diacylglycerol-glycerol-3-phosphate 3-phosphatidyltransferase n=1 Tax=Candidatus Roizmanbacteria bacterium GW2011_GWB1_40_7 TaxID=1618482 RepID=A0A0G0SZG2_9BACT|nr:MAG: CDP-diacylglycerol-glycerol-3-phosphate 3-phosphatidyltransferase [Candidatus Roizmanbacteria bacterium GW2011_GWB1_40_7]